MAPCLPQDHPILTPNKNVKYDNYKILGLTKIRVMLLHTQHFHNKLYATSYYWWKK